MLRNRIALGLVVAALLSSTVVFGILWRQADSREVARQKVATVAGQFLRALTNFQASTIDQNVKTIRSYAVGDFADQVNTFFGPQTVAALRKANARSTGQVASVFVESISGGTASVFGVVNEAVSNVNGKAPRAEVLRLDVQMIDTKGGWKVNRVDILQSPNASPFGSG